MLNLVLLKNSQPLNQNQAQDQLLTRPGFKNKPLALKTKHLITKPNM